MFTRTSANIAHHKLSTAGVSFLDVRPRPNLHPLEEKKADWKKSTFCLLFPSLTVSHCFVPLQDTW